MGYTDMTVESHSLFLLPRPDRPPPLPPHRLLRTPPVARHISRTRLPRARSPQPLAVLLRHVMHVIHKLTNLNFRRRLEKEL
jgi:hypothetical protein